MPLLSIIGKAFTRLVLNRLQTLAERLYPEELCGFRAGRSTIDMIFSLRQLQEKCPEQRKHLHIALIDLTKAFDLVSRVYSLSCRELDAPQASKDDHVFPWRHARNRLVRRPGYVLAATLFGIFLSLLLSYAFSQSEDGVYLHTRSDRHLFNLARLRAKTKVRKVLLREMLFTGDAALTAHTESALQRLISSFAHACSVFGLTISLKKTNILGQDVSSTPSISIGDYTLEVVEDFTYLGSTISINISLDTELKKRIGKAAAALARLGKRVWDNTMLTISKMKVYQVGVI